MKGLYNGVNAESNYQQQFWAKILAMILLAPPKHVHQQSINDFWSFISDTQIAMPQY